jgi:hypothetical protein
MCPVHETSTIFQLLKLRSNSTNYCSAFIQYILEQLVCAAPHEWIHLCLGHGIDWPSFPRVELCCPSCSQVWLGFTAWVALVSVINNLSVPAVPQITHTGPPTNLTRNLNHLHMFSIMGAQHIIYIHIQITVLLLVLLPGYQAAEVGTHDDIKSVKHIFGNTVWGVFI